MTNPLAKYAQHLPLCPALATDGPNAPYPCKCGLDALLTADEPAACPHHAQTIWRSGNMVRGQCEHCGEWLPKTCEDDEPAVGRQIGIFRDEAEFIVEACEKDGAPQWWNLEDQCREKFGMVPRAAEK